MEWTDYTNNRAWVSPNLLCWVIRYEKCGEWNLSINSLLVVEFFYLTHAQSPDMLLMKENDGDDNGYLIFVLSAIHLS